MDDGDMGSRMGALGAEQGWRHREQDRNGDTGSRMGTGTRGVGQGLTQLGASCSTQHILRGPVKSGGTGDKQG